MLDDFYHYIDLTNEQVFLRIQGRVTAATWRNWREGIEGHLSRPAFQRAWEEIKLRAPESFTELRRLCASDFREDPKSWRRRLSGRTKPAAETRSGEPRSIKRPRAARTIDA